MERTGRWKLDRGANSKRVFQNARKDGRRRRLALEKRPHPNKFFSLGASERANERTSERVSEVRVFFRGWRIYLLDCFYPSTTVPAALGVLLCLCTMCQEQARCSRKKRFTEEKAGRWYKGPRPGRWLVYVTNLYDVSLSARAALQVCKWFFSICWVSCSAAEKKTHVVKTVFCCTTQLWLG